MITLNKTLDYTIAKGMYAAVVDKYVEKKEYEEHVAVEQKFYKTLAEEVIEAHKRIRLLDKIIEDYKKREKRIHIVLGILSSSSLLIGIIALLC